MFANKERYNRGLNQNSYIVLDIQMISNFGNILLASTFKRKSRGSISD